MNRPLADLLLFHLERLGLNAEAHAELRAALDQAVEEHEDLKRRVDRVRPLAVRAGRLAIDQHLLH